MRHVRTWWRGLDYTGRVCALALAVIVGTTVAGAVAIAHLPPRPPAAEPAVPTVPPASPSTTHTPAPVPTVLPSWVSPPPASLPARDFAPSVPVDGQPSGETLNPEQAFTVTPGTFCPHGGATGRSATGATYVCRQKGDHARWEPGD